MSILIVEDNEVNQKVIKAILQKRKIAFILANDGREAIDLLAQQDFDLILMDCQMPVLDGYHTTQIIRQIEIEKQKPRCPIIAVTANAMSNDKEKCLTAGMDDFLPKPFQIQEIVNMIQKWMPVEKKSG